MKIPMVVWQLCRSHHDLACQLRGAFAVSAEDWPRHARSRAVRHAPGRGLAIVRLGLVIAMVLASGRAARAVPGSWLFVSLLTDRTIVAFERDAVAGTLVRRAETACPAEPGVMCLAPDGRTLFVAMRSSGQLASFRIDATSGALHLLSLAEGGSDPCYLLADRSGKFLLTAYYVANQVTVHEVTADGKLRAKPVQVVATAEHAHGLAMDASGRMVFVPHTGANRIFQFRFDPDTGRLTASRPAYAVVAEGLQPRHIALHPSGRWAYSNNEAGDSLSVYDLDADSVTLHSVQTVSTLPSGVDGAKNATARCELTPDGRFVYVTNRGHDSLAGFAVDPSSGRVRSLGQTATEKTPRSFSIDPAGRYVFAAGQDSGVIACYAILDEGALSLQRKYDVGPMPWCVLACDLP